MSTPAPRSNGVAPANGVKTPSATPKTAAAQPAAAAAAAPGAGVPVAASLFPAAPPVRAKSERAPAVAPAVPAAATAAPPIVPVPIVVKEPAAGSLDLAIAQVLEIDALPPDHGASTASDAAALQSTFEELAIGHVAPIRSAMMEVRWGEAQVSWLEVSQPALKSLRKMAAEVESNALVAALDGFLAALQKLLEPGQPPVLAGAARDGLVAAYAPLCACLPRAFELDGERERREPIVVRALLEQVAGLDPLMIDKMMAAGLGGLATLGAAKADEIAAVTGIPEAIAAATAARVQAFRRASPAALATVDPAATVRELGGLLEQLRASHAAFEVAARGWTDADRQSKKQLRWQRQVGFLQATIALVQLGEIDLAVRLPKLTFARRIDEVGRVFDRMAAAYKVDFKFESGPHPAAA